ncbi:DUF305 domain-containing protein [Streptomyces sp. Amel2xC10]|uniref:DUF305 domain-containing protein n=1 Tax=Streptomyces sp. Amel2xC10 TaxID=1305826 RepID=UPI000A089ED0|nr:DUF305 domain-containing protein [Streptomyces sp. Amel2xC10]SMF57633.1 Uncharacterized conserved protein, DUF305 family [Streptomyces sp. Amel2xC10]
MHSKRFLVRRTVAVVAAGAAALVLVACGGDSDGGDGQAAASASAAQGTYGAADVAFAKGMVPHHRQAVEMAGLAAGRARSPEVKKLAEDIEKAQGPEIETLSGWLVSWGEEVPAPGAMDHSMHSGTGGMMDAEEMDGLKGLSGSAFDTAFLRMMIEHHNGAVAMAEVEQADGAYAPAKAMAGDIIASQTAEITRMNDLLGQD